ncbi:MAG TPA: DUF423 domain-containing protein, partial [Candidatus Solibacter sp.]|nr:DUF423 domain-containing protein [Candidatus Solibacter sp.]
MNWSATGAFLLALGVVLGAFGAHQLKDRLNAYSMGLWEKAVFYHFIHALGLLVVALLPRTGTFAQAAAARVCLLLAVGIVVFSGSLYALALTRQPYLGAITPIGGVSMIAGW